MTTRTTLLAGALLAVGGAALADTSDKRIALSNNYAGNSWRQAMLTSWDTVTKPAVEQGIVAAADPFTTAENQATEQAAQPVEHEGGLCVVGVLLERLFQQADRLAEALHRAAHEP